MNNVIRFIVLPSIVLSLCLAITDIFVFRGMLLTALSLLAAMAYCIYSGILRKNAIRVAFFLLVAILSNIFERMGGWIINRNIQRTAESIAFELNQVYEKDGNYPLSSDPRFIKRNYWGYRIRYISLGTNEPYLYFDKFNYIRQTLYVRDGKLGPEKPE